jgi:hypothetical protein
MFYDEPGCWSLSVEYGVAWPARSIETLVCAAAHATCRRLSAATRLFQRAPADA